MDLLQCRFSWLVRVSVDRAAFTDWLDRLLWISRPRRGLDCSDWARHTVHSARRCEQAPTLDDSQLRPHRCRDHSAHVLASYLRVSLAFFDRLPHYRVALLDSQRARR